MKNSMRLKILAALIVICTLRLGLLGQLIPANELISIQIPEYNFVYDTDDFISDLVKLYDEYKIKCYNDSTQECFNVYVYNENKFYEPCSKYDFDLGINPGYRGKENIWIHKKPTFEGFIQFLRDKQP